MGGPVGSEVRSTSRESVVVSVQASSAVDALAGHLAWGALLDRDVVVVPPPLTWLDGHDRFEVLVASGDREVACSAVLTAVGAGPGACMPSPTAASRSYG